jgi:hypothetical protein
MDSSLNVSAAMQELTSLIDEIKIKFETLTSDELLLPPAPGKWGRQQVLGHLVDSAINNLKRFTDAQFSEPPYVVIGYKQEALMEANDYQHLPLSHIIDLWQALNRQIVFVVARIPAEKLAYEVQTKYVTPEPQTLEWLICDYVVHMKHHLTAMKMPVK